MKREILDEVTFLGYGHGEFFLEFVYNVHQKGFKIKEVPYIQKKFPIIGVSTVPQGVSVVGSLCMLIQLS